MTDIIERIEHLRAVHQQHQELEVARVRFLRMQLIRSILGGCVSEFHVAAQLKATPFGVGRLAFSGSNSTHVRPTI